MFERFSNEARQVVVRSQEISRKRKVGYIPSEHLLLSLLEDHPDLWGLIDDPSSLTALLEQSTPEGIQEPRGHIPFTPNAKKVFEMTLREMLAVGMNVITPGHFLLAMLRQSESGAGKALAQLGISIESARTVVVKAGESIEHSDPVQVDTLSDVVRDLESLVGRLRNLLS